MPSKIFSWNVNGIRACQKKGFSDWFQSESPDILCLQEVKAEPEQVDTSLSSPEGYHSIWNPAEKKGYSGVVTMSKKKPGTFNCELGIKKFDSEGRTIISHYPKFTLINCYFPNGQRDHARVPFKMEYCKTVYKLCKDLLKEKKKIIICGDFNTAHEEIDLKNPKSNRNTTGFLEIERAWVTQFIKLGMVDIFRVLTPAPDHYTWWSYRPGVRERNVGWRIDYFFISPNLEKHVMKAFHQPEVLGSDHCPIGLELDI